MGSTPNVDKVADLTRELVDLSGRLLRFEPVTAEEIARFVERRDAVIERDVR